MAILYEALASGFSAGGRYVKLTYREFRKGRRYMWEGPAFEIHPPRVGELPLVVASPHSGSLYPPDLLDASALDPHELRRSEDCYVHELVSGAEDLGIVVIRALFPRAYVDVNREPYELDPLLFDEALPDYANQRSPRVAAGLGTIARVVANGKPIYRRKLAVWEGLERLERCYIPYHQALRELIDERVARFGFCVLLDCHSMPSLAAGPGGEPPAQIVLGDCHGASAGPALVELALRSFRGLGYRVAYNAPYAGGFVTRQYGRPERGVHALQIELARSLYMDETSLERSLGLLALKDSMTGLLTEVADWALRSMPLPRAAE